MIRSLKKGSRGDNEALLYVCLSIFFERNLYAEHWNLEIFAWTSSNKHGNNIQDA